MQAPPDRFMKTIEEYIALGASLMSKGAYAEAGRRLKRAVEDHPDSATAFANLALAQEKQKQLDAAEANYRKARSLEPASIEIRFCLATFLASTGLPGKQDEAKEIFLGILQDEPAHYGTLCNFGKLLFETGYTSAAATVFNAAANAHPLEITPRLNLANIDLSRGEWREAKRQYLAVLDYDPGSTAAHQGLASAYRHLGDEERADFHRERGFSGNALSVIESIGNTAPHRLLMLASARGGNVPWNLLIDREQFETTLLVVEYFDARASLPPHGLIFNAIGDAELCAPALQIAKELVAQSQAPVINTPQRVMESGRVDNARRLRAIPNLRLPAMARASKSALLENPEAFMAATGLRFPLLLRAPGFHGGDFFTRTDDASGLKPALDALPGTDVTAIEYLDAQAGDGYFRKFRAMVIDGALYPVHMAASEHWKVHYFSSNMMHSTTLRNEEKAYLDDFQSYLGAQATETLRETGAALGLDYCGMDFGLDRDGKVCLFEANATMLIAPPASDTMWDYRHGATEAAWKAARRMFLARAGSARLP